MKKLAFTFITLIFLLVTCQAYNPNAITLKKVLSSFEEQQLSLKDSKINMNDNIFGMKLNGVRPSSHTLEGKMLLIYIYRSKDEREEGLEDWREKTVSINTVSFKVYEVNNALLFYVYERDLNREIDNRIQNVVSGLSVN